MRAYGSSFKVMAIGLTLTAVLVWGVAAAEAVSFRQIDHPGAIGTYAFDVNNSGKVVGYYSVNEGSGLVYRGFLYDGVTFTPINVPGASNTLPAAITDAGRVVGGYFIGDRGNWNLHGFIYENGHYTYPIDEPIAQRTVLNGINNAGQMVGSFLDPDGKEFGFLYNGVSFVPIYAYELPPTEAMGINDQGIIVGYYTETGCQRGFKLDGSQLTPIDFPGGPGVTIISTGACSITRAGKIAGTYIAAGTSGTTYHGFTYLGGSYQTFDIPGAGQTFLSRLKDTGRMVGYFTVSTGAHGFLTNADAGPVIDLLLLD